MNQKQANKIYQEALAEKEKKQVALEKHRQDTLRGRETAARKSGFASSMHMIMEFIESSAWKAERSMMYHIPEWGSPGMIVAELCEADLTKQGYSVNIQRGDEPEDRRMYVLEVGW